MRVAANRGTRQKFSAVFPGRIAISGRGSRIVFDPGLGCEEPHAKWIFNYPLRANLSANALPADRGQGRRLCGGYHTLEEVPIIAAKATIELDEGGLGNLKSALNSARTCKVKIGIFGGVGKRESTPQYAFWQEFGTVAIPARSFLRTTPYLQWDLHQTYLRLKRPQYLQWLIEGDFNAIAKDLGAQWANMVGITLAQQGQGIWKPLAKSTVEKKGHDIMLYDTGALRDNVTFEVT